MLTTTNYNPDVLSCLANLSNDEVFTPPQLVNQILDLLPTEIWSDKNARFLDPFCKIRRVPARDRQAAHGGIGETDSRPRRNAPTTFSKTRFSASPSRN